jgi:hypothetical protein
MNPKSAEESFQIFEFEIKNFKVSDEFFMGYFKILQKKFKTYQDFCDAEAYFIRILRLPVNDQTDHEISLYF